MITRLPIGIKTAAGVVKEVNIAPLDGFCREIINDENLRIVPAKMTTALLMHCVKDVGGNTPTEELFRNMFVTDRNAIMFNLQIHSIGTEVLARYSCPWCKAGYEKTEDLTEFGFVEWPIEDFKETVSVTLNQGYTDKEGGVHKNVTFGIPTGIDEEVTGAYLRKNYGEWCDRMIARKAIKFGTLDMAKFVGLGIKVAQSMSLPDIDLCISAITKDLPGYDIMHEVTCPKCAKESKQVLDMSGFF